MGKETTKEESQAEDEVQLVKYIQGLRWDPSILEKEGEPQRKNKTKQPHGTFFSYTIYSFTHNLTFLFLNNFNSITIR